MAELTAGKPFLGQEGPEGARFLGWVLVQVWEQTPTSDGIAMQWSGDEATLIPRARLALDTYARGAWPEGQRPDEGADIETGK